MAEPNWEAIRREFDLEFDRVNLVGMVAASHPRPVRRAIDYHRDSMDRQPWPHILGSLVDAEASVCKAVGDYFDVDQRCVALTGSTTEGLALLYAGLRVGREEEILSTAHEFSAVKEILRLRHRRDGTTVREFRLYRDPSTVTVGAVLKAIEANLKPATRALAVTWVNSGDGVKLPIPEIAALLRDRKTPAGNAIRLCVDGVHGFGVENTTFRELGCDFLAAGCHKWVLGPRGTGITCGTTDAWAEVDPIVPSFSNVASGPGAVHSPGGLHAYEHRWALAEAFRFLLAVGKSSIANRVEQLATVAKNGLESAGAVVRTPMEAQLSSGIICFDIKKKDGSLRDPVEIVAALEADGVICTTSSKNADGGRHVRWSLGIFNDEQDIERALKAIRCLV